MSRIQLFINGLPSPLGVPKSGLEFSWKYTGIFSPQASYRLSVALSGDDLNPPVYDSGVVVSSDHLNICVPAACFPCRTALYACVSVTLEDGTSLVSELTEFSVTDGSWNAEWIWKDDSVRVNDYAVFQRKFTVKNAPAFAHIYVSAHHNYKLTVNGRKSEDLSPLRRPTLITTSFF